MMFVCYSNNATVGSDYIGNLTGQQPKFSNSRDALREFDFPTTVASPRKRKGSQSVFDFKNHMVSKLERRIDSLIRQQFPIYKIQRNIRPEWLVSTRDERLELDFYLPEVKLAFEAQGGQHYQYVKHFHPNPGDFERQLERDRSKREICKNRGIVLIDIASVDDYENAQPEILLAVARFENIRLQNHILEKASQTIINIVALRQQLRELELALVGENVTEIRKRIEGKIARRSPKIRRNLEMNYELLRYISIRAIQDFHGVLPFKRRKGWKYAQELRQQGKRIFFYKNRKGKYHAVTEKRWI